MQTTYPTRRSQSHKIWIDTIKEELNSTREHIAALELTTAIWRNDTPRRERCERSWAASK